MKKIIALTLSIIMAFSLSISAFADNGIVASGTCGDKVTWELDENGLLTISGTGAMKDYVNKSPFNAYADQIVAAKICEGVTTIGNYAFYQLPNLASVEIAEGVEKTGTSCFARCTSLTSIAFPSTLKTLGQWTFSYCANLQTVILPEGMETIQNHAFYYCTSLTDIVIPSTVSKIASYPFVGCSSLSTVTFTSEEAPTMDSTLFLSTKTSEDVIAYYPSSWTSVSDDYSGVIWQVIPTAVYVEDVTAKIGEEITVPVYVKNVSSISGYWIKLDCEVASLKDVSVNPAYEDITLAFEFNEKNGQIIWAGSENIEEDSVLCYVTLAVNKDAEIGEHTYGFAVKELNDGDVNALDAKSEEGVITIETVLGDVTLDGEVTNADVVAIARYLVSLVEFSDVQLKYADVNGDGTVSNSDVVKLAKSLV